MTNRIDVTQEYEFSCVRQIEADRAHQKDLAKLIGTKEAKEPLAGWCSKLAAIREGLFLREVFVCDPASF